jgi:hypothetical protein
VGDKSSQYEQAVSIEALQAREREKVLVRSKLNREGCDFTSSDIRVGFHLYIAGEGRQGY